MDKTSVINNGVKIAAVVVTCNRVILLKKCVNALLSQTCSEILDVIIVDNNSSDGTGDLCKSFNTSKVKYFNTEQNLGGAGGFNYGIKKAYELCYDFVWIMDDDTIPNKKALEALITAAREAGDFGYLASKVVWKDDSMFYMNIPKVSIIKRIKDFNKNMQEIWAATFVSILVPMKVIKDLGLPISDFFIYTDDLEYTARIAKKYKCFYVSNSKVVHLKDSDVGADISRAPSDNIDVFMYMYRNDTYFYLSLGIKGVIANFFRIFYHIIKVLRFSKTDKFKRIKIIVAASLQGLKFKPKIEFLQ